VSRHRHCGDAACRAVHPWPRRGPDPDAGAQACDARRRPAAPSPRICASSAMCGRTRVDAFATVPRERFVGPGPWRILQPDDGYWTTPTTIRAALSQRAGRARRGARPQHRRAVAVGAPFRPLGIERGERVLQIGTGSATSPRSWQSLVRPERRRVEGIRSMRRWRQRPNAISRPWPVDPVRQGRCQRARVDGRWDLIVPFAGATAPARPGGSTGLATAAGLLVAMTAGNISARGRLHAAPRERAGRAWPHLGPVGSASIPAPAHAAPRAEAGLMPRWTIPAGQQAVAQPAPRCARRRTKSCWLHAYGLVPVQATSCTDCQAA
jgi:protein-L-isoaspartate(D-aspartate) O-methyltransferase